jgi:hypothetical protein
VQTVPIAKRMRTMDLGEPNPDNSPASLTDVLYRMSAFRERGDSNDMSEILVHSGQGKNTTLLVRCLGSKQDPARRRERKVTDAGTVKSTRKAGE